MDAVESKWYEMDMSLNDAKNFFHRTSKTCRGALLPPDIT